MPWIVLGAVIHVPAVACVEIITPTTRNATLDRPVVEYAVEAEFDPAAIVVVVISVVSSRLVPPEMFTTASSTVPALLMAKTTSCDCTALTVPSVAVDGTVNVIGEVTVAVEVVPLPNVVLRKASEQAFKVIVKALAATDAETG